MAENQKVKGVADIVFLVDATGSMQSCIDGLKNNLNTFIDSLTTPNVNNVLPVKDWRAKIVGFRDYEEDGANSWLEDNPFVTDVDQLKSQLSRLVAQGGGDEPESLLDALFIQASMPQTEKGAPAEPYKWRYRRSATRIIIIFSDASYKRSMAIPAARGGGIDDVRNVVYANRIFLSIFAPDLSCYDQLSEFDRAEYNPAAGVGLDELTSNQSAFQDTLRQLAASVSASSEIEVL